METLRSLITPNFLMFVSGLVFRVCSTSTSDGAETSTSIWNLDGISLPSRRKSLKGLSVHLDNARPHNACRSTECLHAKRYSGYGTRLTAQTSHQVTSSFLVLSSETHRRRHPWPAEPKTRDHLHFRRNRMRNFHSCLRNLDQSARLGDKTRPGIFPSANEEWKKMHENPVKTGGYGLFNPLIFSVKGFTARKN
jgi:hypothetical protein